MTFAPHRMPRDLFEALARGEGGVTAIAALAAAQHSRQVILVRGVLKMARPDDRFAVRGAELLAEARRHDPAAADLVICHPSVGAWALRTLRGDRGVPGSEPGRLSAVAAAAAIRAGLPAEIEVPVSHRSVMLPSLGAAAANGSIAVVRTVPPQVRSPGLRVAVERNAPGWLELRKVRAGSLSAIFDDLDPFRLPAADELAPRLTAAEAAEWNAMLHDAWGVLAPDTAEEIAAAVRVIVPYETPAAGHVSSSSPEAGGTVGMSRQPDRHTCAATLVHEAQHLKLSALLDLVALTLPDDGRRYYAPWRADPRPASGLLQGAYAFLGVSRFWRQQRQAALDMRVRQRADAEFARWRAAAAEVARTLRTSGRLTSAGQHFVDAMVGVLDGWLREPVPDTALAIARRENTLHRMRWQAANGTLPA